MDLLKDWKGIALIIAVALIFMIAKWNKDNEVRKRIDQCFVDHPDWAREAYDPRTPESARRAIIDTCLGNPI